MPKPEAIQEPLTAAGKMIAGGVTVSGGAAAWAWLGDNAEQLTAIFGFVGMLCAVGGFCLALYRGRDK